MKIYKIATKKEAKFADWFADKSNDFEKVATQYVKDYFEVREKLPTVGDVILNLMKNKSLNTSSVNQDFLKTLASSVLTTFRNVPVKD